MPHLIQTSRTTIEALQLPRSGFIEVEPSLCLTCRECEIACSLYHEEECNPELSRIRVKFDDFAPGLPTLDVCKQCDWPACYYACIARWDEPAMRIDATTGTRFIESEQCRGCDACVRACPLTPEHTVIFAKKVDRKRVYYKCDLCYERPEGPVCVEICPGKALKLVLAGERRK